MDAGILMLIVRNPEDGEVIGEVPATTSGEIDAALERARVALRQRRSPAHARVHWLETAAQAVERERESYANLIATEGIKTIREARSEAARAALTLRASAEEAKRIGGELVPLDHVPKGEGRLGFYRREAAGVVAAITPFNDPLNLVAHKVGPAIAAGAPVILKPHPQTPFSALRLHRAFLDAGLPPDLFQVVNGGAEEARRLVESPIPRVISFTGGRMGGAAIARAAGMKKLSLELGGVGLVIVGADADVAQAADAIHAGAFAAAGQNCVHVQRVIAEGAVAPALVDRLVAKAGTVRLGRKKDPETDMGPLVDATSARRVSALITAARNAGARVLTGGRCDGVRVAPTWLADAPDGHAVLREEIFGPVSTIETVDSFADALDRLRRAPAALHVAAFTRSIAHAMQVYGAADAGAVIINDSTDFRVDTMPFGGVGAAGLGREGLRFAIDDFSEKKLFVLASA